MAFSDAFDDFSLDDEKRINDERGVIFHEIKDLAKKRDADAQDIEKLEKLEERLDQLTKQRDAGLRLRNANRNDAEIVGEREEKTGTPLERYNEVFVKYLRVGVNDLNPEERDLLMNGADKELRVQQTLTGSAGGFLVPDGFWNRLVEAQADFGTIEAYANVLTTATGNDLPWLTGDDTSNTGELIGEGDQVSEQDVVFGTQVLRAFTYSSKMIRVSWQLMQDSVIDIEGYIARQAGKRLARIHTTHLTTGDGVNKPQGITVGLTGGKAAASATVWTHDELIDIQHILDPAYRNGNQRWMFADSTLKSVRKIVDGDGNKAWQPGLVSGMPDQLLGDPYVVNQAMPVNTTGNVSILYGDFNEGYIVRRVKGATAVRLNELFAQRLQTGFFVYDRIDGRPDVKSAYTYGIQA